ncbi:MAG: aspartate aminotransferase family protein [Rhodobacteraceae bacterium]|nr:aspartate aminotransferase family protein [Paracoccaceae bacterium]
MITPVMPTYARTEMGFVKGEGSWVIDEDGNKYLDAGAGIAVSVLGHAHPRLVQALTSQAQALWHTSNLYRIPNQERLAELLVDNTFADTVFFNNSGAEAVETAVKMARRHWHACGSPERNEIITLEHAFHGRTLGMISAAPSPKLTDGFAPLLPGFRQVVAGDLDEIASAVGENTAAILVEPILGEGGIIPLSDSYLKGLRKLCNDHGVLLILDEIQCGMGRTGKLFAHQWAGIAPDIMAIAKGIGGGFPLGACLATEKAASGMTVGTHGSTYGGNPLACAVGCEVLKIVSDEDFLQVVRRTAGQLRQGLEAIVAGHPNVFEDVRGSGLMLGLKCRSDNMNMEVVSAGYDQRILLVPAADNVVRILPPLNISPFEVATLIQGINRSAQSLDSKQDA